MSGQAPSPPNSQFQTPRHHQPQPSPSFAPVPESLKPQETASAKRSRSRPTKSCEQCRRKKLKCNRELPCSQCLKGGRDGSSCHFEHGPEAGERGTARDEGMERGLKRFRVDVEEPRRSSVQSMVQRDAGPPNLMQLYPSRTEAYASQGPAVFIPSRPQGFFGNYASPTYATPESAPGAGSSTAVPTSTTDQRAYPSSTLGRIHVKGRGSRYISSTDKMAMLDHVSSSCIWCRCWPADTRHSLKTPRTS